MPSEAQLKWLLLLSKKTYIDTDDLNNEALRDLRELQRMGLVCFVAFDGISCCITMAGRVVVAQIDNASV